MLCHFMLAAIQAEVPMSELDKGNGVMTGKYGVFKNNISTGDLMWRYIYMLVLVQDCGNLNHRHR